MSTSENTPSSLSVVTLLADTPGKSSRLTRNTDFNHILVISGARNVYFNVNFLSDCAISCSLPTCTLLWIERECLA